LPTRHWTKWVKSFGRRNGFDLKTKYPCRQNDCLTARILLPALCHFDASIRYLVDPDPHMPHCVQEEEKQMVQPTGIHHIAIMTGDMKKQIAFFSDVLGAPLVAIFDMHGVPGGIHAFLRLDTGCYFSLVQLPDTAETPSTLGITHAGTGAGNSAPGTMQHLAFYVTDEAALLAMRDRIRTKGVNVIGPLDHGMCKSIYFAGPEQLTLEVACPGMAVTAERWVDPAVLAKVGISAEEAAGFANPDRYAGEGGSVKQPEYDATKPHMAYPEDRYKMMIAMPDEMLAAMPQHNEPPVPA
jgi:catechol 2,3-dioxygenase-like lactoylglutathione lyase family enzyme